MAGFLKYKTKPLKAPGIAPHCRGLFYVLGLLPLGRYPFPLALVSLPPVDCPGGLSLGFCPGIRSRGWGLMGSDRGKDMGYCTPPSPSRLPLKTINRIPGRFPGEFSQGFKPSTNSRNQLKVYPLIIAYIFPLKL